MAAVCRGAELAGGLTVGVLPGSDPAAANEWVDVIIVFGLGERAECPGGAPGYRRDRRGR